jgi:hypothetical protein
VVLSPVTTVATGTLIGEDDRRHEPDRLRWHLRRPLDDDTERPSSRGDRPLGVPASLHLGLQRAALEAVDGPPRIEDLAQVLDRRDHPLRR